MLLLLPLRICGSYRLCYLRCKFSLNFPKPRVAYLQPNLTEALIELFCANVLKKSACCLVWDGLASADQEELKSTELNRIELID